MIAPFQFEGGSKIRKSGKVRATPYNENFSAEDAEAIKERLELLLELVNDLNVIEAAVDEYGDLPTDAQDGTRIWVIDASGDPTVSAGWAIYRSVGDQPSGDWVKVAEQESLDLVLDIASITGLQAALDSKLNGAAVTITSPDAGATFTATTGTNYGIAPHLLLATFSTGNTTGTPTLALNGGTARAIYDVNTGVQATSGKILNGRRYLVSYVHPLYYIYGLEAASSGGTAATTTFTPDGDIAATNVQAAIVEVRNDTDTKLGSKLNTSLVAPTWSAIPEASDIATLNPTKLSGNNFTFAINADKTINYLNTDVPDGASGRLVVTSSGTTDRSIVIGSNIWVHEDGVVYKNKLGTSSLTITNVVSEGGVCKATTSGAHSLATGDYVSVADVLGTHEANGFFPVEVVDSTNVLLTGSIFTNTYVSGGTMRAQQRNLKFKNTTGGQVLFDWVVRDGVVYFTTAKQNFYAAG